MDHFEGLNEAEASAFTSRWLPAWTGNNPRLLAGFYTEDGFYSDPAVPGGLHGRAAIESYFQRLLSKFPDWVWTNTAVRPLKDGFLNYWHATIPTGGGTVECDGVCTVILSGGLIARNEVFFDRSALLRALE